ncbi:MAG TPA: serine protease [Verrucomicrobiae bacterium]|jgi:S1-C subfamily serine protease
MTLAAALGFSALGDGITSVQINDNEYTNITDVHISGNGKIFVSGANGMTVVSADKLPGDFLKSWNINVAAADAAEKQKAADQLNAAIAAGDFRKVGGMVYDIRKPESGWVTCYGVKVLQVLDDGALVDLTPNDESYYPVHIKNLGTVADTDTINFSAKPIGTYSYENKLGDGRTVRGYDVGIICSRDEIPDSVLSGQKAYDIAIQSGTPNEDVLSKLPQSNDLQANGSGFFVSADGYLVTNFHVVKDAKQVKVKTGSGVYPAEIVKTDQNNDLALLKVTGHFKPLPVSQADAQLGEAVFTIGFPDIILQGIQPKYTDGKISSLAGIKDDPKDYQISVPVQPGNSGGPLVDMNGNVVGIVEAKLDLSAALAISGDLPQNVNYAIKGKILSDFLAQVPEVKLLPAALASSNGVVSSTQESVAMVLVY